MVEAADMSGKTVVVTGGNSGIGLETAISLAKAGATTIITARSPDRGRRALEILRIRAGHDRVGLVVFDLADMASVRQGATEILTRCPRIDVLVNNAGVVLSKRSLSVDGYEMTLAVNHLGPFLLTTLLLDRLKASAPSRIVNVSSTAHKQARKGLNFGDLHSTAKYRGMHVYGETKLANILFTTELARRLEGTGVTANCLHPGVVATGYARDGDASGLLAIGVVLGKPFLATPAKGAATSIYLASSPDVAGVSGRYFMRCRPATPSAAAQDSAAAARLWEVSEQLVAPTLPPAG